MNELAPLPHSLKPAPIVPEPSERPAGRSRLAAFFDSDLLHSFLRSKLVVVAALLDPRWKVEVEADAVIGAGGG